MRTQPTSPDSDPTISSLDRTDVLPVLDVEAYEATLVESAEEPVAHRHMDGRSAAGHR